jgi:hypothetical protein
MQRLAAFTGIYVQIPVVAVVFPDFVDFPDFEASGSCYVPGAFRIGEVFISRRG